MRLFSFIFIFSFLSLSQASDLETSKNRCSFTTAGESFIYQNDFQNPAMHLNSSWWWTLNEMEEHFYFVYNSGKRLNNRAYYDSKRGQFILPMVENPYIIGQPPTRLGDVVAPEFFIESIRLHIESAIRHRYAEYVFFPDMGHSHFYIDQSHWDSEYSHYIGNGPLDKVALYNKMLSDSQLKMLYHTAEKVLTTDEHEQRLPDEHIIYRYTNRNILGNNQMNDTLEVHFPQTPNKGNTVGGIPNHKLWSAGYYIHSSKDGCFAYEFRGETYYYDISLHDPGQDPSIPRSGDYM